MLDGENREQAIDVPATIRVLMPNGQVSQMQLETYLAGAVAVEIGTNVPLEALKAQAVASRTYAACIHRHSECGADVCTTAHCQAWRRVDPIVAPEVFRAISETWGMVATFDQKPIEAFFFEHCDGHTRNSEDLLMAPLPYLRRVDCACGFVSLKGHGVGLCQRGAIVMARQGASFEEILRHYYKDIRIVQIGRQQAEAAAAAQPARNESGSPSAQAEQVRPIRKSTGASEPATAPLQPAPEPAAPSSSVAQAPAKEAVERAANSSGAVESAPAAAGELQAQSQPMPIPLEAAISPREPAAAEPIKGNGHQAEAEGDQANVPPEIAPYESEATTLRVAPMDAQEAEKTDGVQAAPMAGPLQERMPSETTELVDTAPHSTEEAVQFLLPPLQSGEMPAVLETPAVELELKPALGLEAEPASGAESGPAVGIEPKPIAEEDSTVAPVQAPAEIVQWSEPSVEAGFLPPEVLEPSFSAEEGPPAIKPRVHVDHLPGARIIGGCLAGPGIMVRVRDEKGSETLIYSGSAPQYGKGGFETVVDEDGRYFVSIEQETIEVFVRGDTVFIHTNE